MGTSNFSTHAGLVSAGDWVPVLAACWNDIKADGGTILLDVQQVTLKSPRTDLLPPGGYEVPVVIRGDGGSRVIADATAALLFYYGNMDKMTFEKFAILGIDGHSQDCGAAIYGAYGDHVHLREMVIGGLACVNAVYAGTNTSLSLENTRIGGCGASDAVVKLDGGPKLTMKNVKLLDYLLMPNVYLSKTPGGASPAWVQAVNPPTRNGQVFGRVCLEDCEYDEGGQTAIWVEDYPVVDIHRNAINVCGATTNGGIYLKNVANARITGCNIGYDFTSSNAIAIKLENCGHVFVDGLKIDHNVTRIVRDAATQLTLINSPGVLVDVV